MPFLGAPLASQTGRATKNNSMGDRNLNGETGSFALPDNGMGIENSMTQQKQVPIAICGMGMRLPGSINNASALYDFLLNKKDARGPVPKNRFNNNGFYSQYGKPGTLPIDHGYWLDQIDLSNFDGSLFSMSSAEIEKLDPQQRLLLEVVWEAFENAGETGWRGSNIGCYVGSFGEEWNNLHVKDSYNSGFHWITGCMDLTQANRISYEYDLKGPRQVFLNRSDSTGRFLC
jgi:acyl transferase domain-containing protein